MPDPSIQWRYTTTPEGDDVLWVFHEGEWLRLGTLPEAADLIGGLFKEAAQAKVDAYRLLEQAKKTVDQQQAP